MMAVCVLQLLGVNKHAPMVLDRTDVAGGWMF
jgi:hypothetical protein